MSEEKKEPESTEPLDSALDILDLEDSELFKDIDRTDTLDKKGSDGASVQPDEGEIKIDKLPDDLLTEDELWDPKSNVNDIPLFEEFASELAEQTKKEEELLSPVEEEIQESDIAAPPVEPEHKVEAGPSLVEKTNEDQPASNEIKNITIGRNNPFLLWGLAACAAIMIVAGGLAMLKMTGLLPANRFSENNVIENKQAAPPSALDTSHPRPSGSIKTGSGPQQPGQPQKAGPAITISLSPFLIPAQQNGEMVFFNLQVDVIVQDQKAKDELMQKEVWIRDIIYRELKGLDLGEKFQENILAQYQKPIVDSINTEFPSLKVEDVKLSGSLIR